MSDTRRPRSAGQHDALRALLERMDQRQQSGFQEVHTAIQGVREHLGRTDARVEGLAQDLQREVTHIDTRLGRMYETNQGDIAALRAALEQHEQDTIKEVVKAVGPEEVVKARIMGLLGRAAVPAIAIVLLIKEGPPIVRAAGGFFKWLGSLN